MNQLEMELKRRIETDNTKMIPMHENDSLPLTM